MSRFTGDARLWEILDSPKARLIIERHAPGLLGHADIAALSDVPLRTLADNPRLGVTPDRYAAIVEDLRRPLSHVIPEVRSRRSLDEVDRAGFAAGPSPLDTPARHVSVAAIGLTLERPGQLDSLTADGCFWLDPAEKRTLDVNVTEGLALTGWNLADRAPGE